MGYECEIHQRLARGHPRPVPKFSFDDFVTYLGRGVPPFVASFVYSLPAFVLLGVLMIGWMLVQLSTTWGAARGLQDMEAFEQMASGSTGLPMPGTSGVVLLCVLVACWLFLQLPVTAARLLAERTEDMSMSLSPRHVWEVLRASSGRIVVSYLALTLWSLPLMLGGTLVFCVGAYVAMAGLHLAGAHLRWQIASAHAEAGHPLPPLKAEAPLPSGN